jgi:hypothetical protein
VWRFWRITATAGIGTHWVLYSWSIYGADSGYAAAVIADAPVRWFKMDEAQGQQQVYDHLVTLNLLGTTQFINGFPSPLRVLPAQPGPITPTGLPGWEWIDNPGAGTDADNTWNGYQTFQGGADFPEGSSNEGDVTFSGHVVPSYGNSGTLTAGAQAGTSPPAPHQEGRSSDCVIAMTFGTGSAPAAGEMVVVTFSSLFHANVPFMTLTPRNPATVDLGLYVSNESETAVSIMARNAPAASQANTVYSLIAHVLG